MFRLRNKKINFQLPSLIWGPDKDRMTKSQLNISSGSTSFQKILLDFSLSVKAATLIFISGCGSAISSALRKGNQIFFIIW